MSTNDRADLMQAIAIGLEYTHSAAASTSRRYGGGAFAEIHGVFDLGGIADHLIDQGWRKVDPAADTHTEWAVDHGEYGIGAVGAEDSARARAEHYRGYGAAVRLVYRTVTTGPWEDEQ